MKITINGKEISEQIFSKRVDNLRRENPFLTEEELKKRATDDLIRKIIIDEEAKKRFPCIPEFEVNAEFEKIKKRYPSEEYFRKILKESSLSEDDIKEDIRSSIRYRFFVDDLTKNIPPPPPQVIEEYYKYDTEISFKPPEVHAAHIVKKPDPLDPMKTFYEMCEIRTKALSGANFADLANKFSSCKDKNGDLGYFSPGKMVEEFEIVVFSMKKGEISPVFKTPFGYHIATVYDIRPPEKLPLKDCARQLQAHIIQKARMKTLEDWLSKEKEKADIKILN